MRVAGLEGKIAAALAAVGILTATPSAAKPRGERVIGIGAGPQVTPKFIGSDELGLFPMPLFDLRREGELPRFEAPDEGIGVGLLGSASPFDVGPSIQIQNKRKDEDVGVAIGEVDTSVELGGFVQWQGLPWMRVRLEGRKAVSGHEGLNGDLMVDFYQETADTRLSLGPRMRFSSARFQRAYFGVDAAQSARTGLAVFQPDGGVHAVGLASSAYHQIDRRWGVYGYAAYDRLVGDAADSPFIRTYGSRNQFSAGLGLTYSFRLSR